ELPVRERGEDGGALPWLSALLCLVDEIDLPLVLCQRVADDLPIALEVLGRGPNAFRRSLLDELGHTLVDLLQLVDELSEEREVTRRSVLAREVSSVAGEHEVRARRFVGERLELGPDLLRVNDRPALLLVEADALGSGVTEPNEVGPLRRRRDPVDAL